MDATVTEVPDRSRYEILVDGEVAGFADYRLEGGQVVFPHTVVRPEFEGKGLGGKLVRAALDEADAKGLAVVAECSFVARWIELHPEYQRLLAS